MLMLSEAVIAGRANWIAVGIDLMEKYYVKSSSSTGDMTISVFF